MEKTQKRDRIRALERFQQGESVSTIANSLAIADVGSTNGSSAREWRARRSPGQRIDPDVRMLTPDCSVEWWKP